MNLLCKLVGHKPREHDYSGGEYMRVSRGTTDGIGREHATLYARCQRCEQEYRAGQIHVPRQGGRNVTNMGAATQIVTKINSV